MKLWASTSLKQVWKPMLPEKEKVIELNSVLSPVTHKSGEACHSLRQFGHFGKSYMNDRAWSLFIKTPCTLSILTNPKIV
jgi:hypothetical protein